ncbi:MAG: hypothetical protein ABIZ34_04605 [Candidatus Limnocylindrales bacterium]
MIFLGLGVLFLVVGGVLAAAAAFSGGAGDFGDDAFLGLAITGGTFLIIGLVFTIVGAAMRRLGVRTERIRSPGVRAQATISDVGETNMTVNRRPVLNLTLLVTVPGRSPYPLKQRIVMPRSALGRIGVGMSVPVTVDPADPNSVVIEWAEGVAPRATVARPNMLSSMGALPAVPDQSTGFAGMPDMNAAGAVPMPQGGEAMIQYLRGMGIDISGPLASMITGAMAAQAQLYGTHGMGVPGQVVGAGSGIVSPSPMMPGVPLGAAKPPAASAAVPTAGPLDIRADASELRRSGRPGRATIRSTTDLGVDVAGKSLLRMDLEVTPDGGPAYPLQHVAMVPESAIARISPGTSVAVHLDPTNPQNLEIDWGGA